MQNGFNGSWEVRYVSPEQKQKGEEAICMMCPAHEGFLSRAGCVGRHGRRETVELPAAGSTGDIDTLSPDVSKVRCVISHQANQVF